MYEVGRDAVTSYGQDRAGRMAAALAYRTLFAIAPLLILAIGVFRLIIGDPEQARDMVVAVVDSLVGEQVGEAIESIVVSAVNASDSAAIIGFALFAWASSSLFMDLQMSLNDIFRFPKEDMRGWRSFLRRRGIALAWSLSFGLLLIAAWIVSAAGGWFVELLPADFGLARRVVTLGVRLAALAIVPLVFMLMYRTMTRVKLRWQALWVGGVVTSLAFLGTAYVAGIYFSWDQDTTAGQIAGSAVVLLLLAYFLSSAILMGAEVTRAYHDRLQLQ